MRRYKSEPFRTRTARQPRYVSPVFMRLVGGCAASAWSCRSGEASRPTIWSCRPRPSRGPRPPGTALCRGGGHRPPPAPLCGLPHTPPSGARGPLVALAVHAPRRAGRAGTPFRLREVADPEGDGALGAAELDLDLVVGHPLDAEFAGAGAEVVLGVGALRPFGRRFALQRAVEDVVVVDVQAIADLAAAEAFAAEGECLGAEAFEVGVFGHGPRLVRNVGFRSRWAGDSVVRAITGGSPENRAGPWWGRCVRWTA